MYQSILVPLDGSELAECVLTHVDALAKGCLVKSITLVRVVEAIRYSGDPAFALSEKMWQQIYAETRLEAQKYLDRVKAQLKYDNVTVKAVLLEGRAADAVAEYAAKNNFDLIVIATHGRSGVGRWVWGSVADRLLRAACVPVFMVRAPGCVPGI